MLIFAVHFPIEWKAYQAVQPRFWFPLEEKSLQCLSNTWFIVKYASSVLDRGRWQSIPFKQQNSPLSGAVHLYVQVKHNF